MLESDQLAGDERAAAGHGRAAQPRLGGDAVLVLAKDRLQLCRGAGECNGTRPDYGCHSLGRVPSTLGEDANAMQLGIRRLFGQLPDRAPQAAPGACR